MLTQETNFHTELDLLGKQVKRFNEMLAMFNNGNWNESGLTKRQLSQKLRNLMSGINDRVTAMGLIMEEQIDPQLES